MRILYKNALNTQNTIFSSNDENNNIENIFDKDIDYIGSFENTIYGEIETTFSEAQKINCVSIFNTNAQYIIFEFYKESGEIDEYKLEIIKQKNIFNIKNTEYKKTKIKIYGYSEAQENIYIGFLMVGLAVDFPAHSPAKTHKINYTREQFFSMAGKYFVRRLPFKSYSEWTVAFNFLTNENKNLILDFFEENDSEPFVLQVWKESDKQKSYTSVGMYGVSEYGKCVYASEDSVTSERVVVENKNNKEVFQMEAGLYVVTNNILEFKKTENKIYQWSLSINFREVK